MNRRGFLKGLVAFTAVAPAIVRPTSIMKVKSFILPEPAWHHVTTGFQDKVVSAWVKSNMEILEINRFLASIANGFINSDDFNFDHGKFISVDDTFVTDRTGPFDTQYGDVQVWSREDYVDKALGGHPIIMYKDGVRII